MTKPVFVIEQVELVPIELLKFSAGNAKLHPEDQVAKLAAGIKLFGFVVPVIIDDNMTLIAGEGRVRGGLHLGSELLPNVPCVRVKHLSDAQIEALMLFDNKIAQTGFDEGLLADAISSLQGKDSDLLGMIGFDGDELTKIIAGLESDGGDEEPEEPKIPTLRFGAYKIQLSLSEESALSQLAEVYLSKNKDLIGFVEHALLKYHV